MRWLRFAVEGRFAYGIVEGDRIREVAGTPFGDYQPTGRVHDLAAVRIEIPVVPPTVYVAGQNYVRHVKGMLGADAKLPSQPDIAYRGANALVAHEQPVVIPADSSGSLHYEGELVVVIGRKAKHLSEEEALGCVLGYTIGNDVSERTWQRSDRTNWRAKNSDTFSPIGPWIETEADMDAMNTVVRLNGMEQIRFSTGDMLFGVARYISRMSRYLTLHPGDVIWMGTDGVSPDVKAGDVVEIEISGIGVLRNPFVADSASAAPPGG